MPLRHPEHLRIGLPSSPRFWRSVRARPVGQPILNVHGFGMSRISIEFMTMAAFDVLISSSSARLQLAIHHASVS